MSKTEQTIGFLSVLHVAELGYCGGFLLLNELGRPIEFHCTLPIKPDRAQEILYGPTLRSYLYSEQIGRSLVEKSKKSPDLVLVDNVNSLDLRQFVRFPIAWINEVSTQQTDRGDTPTDTVDYGTGHTHTDGRAADSVAALAPTCGDRDDRMNHDTIGNYHVVCARDFQSDQNPISMILNNLPVEFRWCEPFQRIHEAIGEAQAVAS